MFCGFNLDTEGISSLFDSCKEKSELSFIEYHKKTIRKSLETYVTSGDFLDAKRIEDDWFPSIKANVFISHSHKDWRIAVAFANWLNKNFGITSFIDSCIWGCADDLLKMIDDKYCVKERNPDGSIKMYDYTKRNQSTSFVHCLLNIALAKMIDNTECLFFLHTPNSILDNEYIKNETSSPWIYSEILISSIIRQKIEPENHFGMFSEHRYNPHLGMLTMHHLDMNHLYTLSIQDLDLWQKSSPFIIPEDSLAKLYQIKEIHHKPKRTN